MFFIFTVRGACNPADQPVIALPQGTVQFAACLGGPKVVVVAVVVFADIHPQAWEAEAGGLLIEDRARVIGRGKAARSVNQRRVHKLGKLIFILRR